MMENEETIDNKEKKVETETTISQCPSCGSGLFYDPKSMGLKCKSCNSIFDFEKNKDNLKLDYLDSKVENYDWSLETRVFHCDTCGAEILITGYDVTTVCPYCGSGYVSKTDKLPGLKPNRVVPFAFNETDAQAYFKKGVRKYFFAPRAIKKKIPENKIRGLLIPSFTFDSNTFSSYDGVLEKVESYRDSKGNLKTKTKRFNISGSKAINYRDLVIESSSKFEQKQINSLLPYDMNSSYHFDYNFLRGYSVEHYQDSLDHCYSKAKNIMDEDIKRKILSGYNYTSVVRLNVSTNYNDRMYSYALLPIYTFEYEYRKKRYVTLMNGQTGKINNKLPISPIKVSILVLLIILAIVAVVLFIMLSE